MRLLWPLSLALLAVVPPLIVLMYLLRLRRQKVRISSVLLWRKSIEDLQANAPFQKLRNNLLMWLQLLVAILAIGALARPMMRLAGLSGQKRIVLVDCSASMKTREAEGPRIDLARRALLTMIDNMGCADQMMIVEFDSEARVTQTFTQDKSRLRAAANALRARDALTVSRSALSLARSAAQAHQNVQVVLLSDGRISDLAKSPESLPPVNYVPIGQVSENSGVVQLDLRETFDREAETQLFATLGNSGKNPVAGLLECRIGGALVDAKQVLIPAAGRSSVIFGGLQNRSGEVELRWVASDAFLSDNLAYGILAPREDTKILLVSSGNFFLERLLSNQPRQKLWKIPAEQYTSSAGYDIVIFDSFAPKTLEPGSYLFINAVPPLEGFSAKPEKLKRPSIIDWSRIHPLTRYVNFEMVQVSQALDIAAPSWIHTLANGEISPLVFAFERDQRQGIVIAFDLFESDWPLRVSFPIFVANATRWLTRMAFSGQEFSYPAGSSYPVNPSAEVKEAVVANPSGKKKALDLTQGRAMYYADTNEIGFYRVKAGEKERAFAVNLLSPEESDIAPAPTLSLRNQEVKGDPNVTKANREAWHYFAIAALAILLIEWLIYCRRMWV